MPMNAKLKRSSRGHYLLNHHDRFHIDLGPNAEHGAIPWATTGRVSGRPINSPRTFSCLQRWYTKRTPRTIRQSNSPTASK